MSRLNYSISQLEEKAVEVRRNIIASLVQEPVEAAGSALAGADLMTALFFYEINFKLDDLDWNERDIWHVSSRALAPALHAAMAEVGFFPLRDLVESDAPGHHLEGFPSSRTPGVEVSGGVLGAGLSVAVGVALASRLDQNPRRVYCVMDDSEMQEGQVWEAAMAAAHFELDNLVLVIDYDGKQADGEIEEIMGFAPLTEKLRAFNWHVLETEGNDIEQVVEAFNRSRSLHGAPVAVLSCTTRGHGAGLFEGAPGEAPGGMSGEAPEAMSAAPERDDGLLTPERAGRALAGLGTTLEEWTQRLKAGDGRRPGARR